METLSGKILLTMMAIISLVLYYTNTYPNGELADSFLVASILSIIGFSVLQLKSFFIAEMDIEQF